MSTLHTQQVADNSIQPNPLSTNHESCKKKPKLVGLLLMLGLFTTCLVIGSLLIMHGIQTQPLADWLSKKAVFFLSIRLGMLVAFYVTWPWIVRCRCRNHAYSKQAIKKLIQQRYWIALLLIGIDILVHL